MENFIYILIGIAWVAYSLYSARQKAIQKQQSAGIPPRGPSQSSPLPIPGNQGEGKSLFDDILRELTGEVRPVQQQVVQPEVPVKKVLSKRVSEPNPKYEGHSGYKFISDTPTDIPSKDAGYDWKKQELSGQTKTDESIAKRFNLREAVIYSELLNPKYF